MSEQRDKPLARGVGRRRLLQGSAAVAATIAGAGLVQRELRAPAPALAAPDAQPAPRAGKIVHSTNPPLEETRLSDLEGWITPNDLFYVRNHFDTLAASADGWTLRVEGNVERPTTLSLTDLRALPSRSTIAFLECAGNSRGRFDPPADGTKWTMGAVGNAEWTGISVSTLLDMVGIKPGSVDLVAEGADSGNVTRGLPMPSAMDPDTMIVWAMNGEPLAPEHGFPLRLFVPGWVGVASIKWLRRLEVLDRPFDGVYNVQRYISLREGKPNEPATLQPVTSAIARPAPNTQLAAGATTVVSGFAWSGAAKISRVELSADGGQTWADARLAQPIIPHAWVRFELPWQPALPGDYVLASRATDETGAVQPVSVEWNRMGYGNNSIYNVPVTVVGSAAPAPAPATPAPTEAPAAAPPPSAPSGAGAQGANASQVEAGSRVYAESCASCHGADGPGGRGPRLVGGPTTFQSWADAQELFGTVKAEMPLNAPGSLSDDQYWSVVAHLLDRNGLNPQGVVLGPDTAKQIKLR
jgi:DMSO/TMAO reductase YedYZ molybdopterin-dependent catalytic subunit/mono/diheme cytochrome c family protein